MIFFFMAFPKPTLKLAPNTFSTSSFGVPSRDDKL
jgi:hypothetical protein